MFNMENIGLKISQLRKSNNMTQMELADKMNISFQAVSNWERGNSMPDISKLPELAQLFGVTIDEILEEKSELLNAVVNDNMEEYLDNNCVTSEQIDNIAPILKPDQVDTIVEKMPIHNLDEIMNLLPFISRNIVNQLARKAAEECNYRDLSEVAPFADINVIDEIADKMVSEGQSIDAVAPFVSQEMISKLAQVWYKEHGLSSLDDIAPFIPKQQLQKIAEVEYEKHGLRYFESIAPFLPGDYLNKLAQKAIQKDGIKAISPIAPFLSKDMLSEYAVKMNWRKPIVLSCAALKSSPAKL